jgi:predicted ATPase
LVEAEFLYQQGLPPQATYRFKHTLIQDAAYQSLLRSTRQQYHQRIAQALEAQFPETVATQPELVAHHYTEAGCYAQAVGYWQQAGQRAVQHSAYAEAVSHYTKGLEVLATLQETPERMQRELDLQSRLGSALMVTKGWGAPEVHRTYDRARALCQHLGDNPQLVPVLRGLHLFYRSRAEYQTARELAEQSLCFAQQRNDPLDRMRGHLALAHILFYQGELLAAHSHFEHVLALSTAQQHPVQTVVGADFGVDTLSTLAWVLWYLGFPDQARRRNQEALMLARELAHPFTLASALVCAALFHQLCQEARIAQEHAEAAMALATKHEFPSTEAWGRIVHGWTLAMQGPGVQGLEQIQQGLAALRATGIEGARPYFLTYLAAAYGMVGQPEAGLQVLAEALATTRTTGEEVYESERYRLKGELLLKQEGKRQKLAEAEECFRQALALARHQQAKSLELRAAMSLARLWQQQGKRAEAYDLLAPIYGWFTEGFDTADLQEAKALLEALA